MISSSIKNNFRKICGYELKERYCNHYLRNESRKDSNFSHLSKLYVLDRKNFWKLAKKMEAWNSKNPCETIYALIGYIKYITEDFTSAKSYFLKTIALNPQNFDNWLDLAFVLRQLGEFKLCNCILFYHSFVIHYYIKLEMHKQPFKNLKKLIFEINKKALATDEY